MNHTAEQYQFLDETLGRALAKPENKSCCSKGCFHCCREPAFASRAQIQYLLETYPTADLEALKDRVRAWLEKFTSGGFHYHAKPSAYVYRAAHLWCPLLSKDGTCSVYERRPMECRFFIAQGDPAKCADDELRKEQKFLESPDIVNAYMHRSLWQLEQGETAEFDHIGVLLAEELLGVKVETMSRMGIQRDGNAVLISSRHENDVDAPQTTP